MKPKCPKCVAALSANGGFVFCTRIGRCKWSRRVSRAAIIRLAVEPKKPETCKWEYSGMWVSGCGDNWQFTQPQFCMYCGKPVEVVNG